jgi:hypothetical protein
LRFQKLSRIADEPRRSPPARDFQDALRIGLHDVFVTDPDNRIIVHMRIPKLPWPRDNSAWHGSFAAENYQVPGSLSPVNRIG